MVWFHPLALVALFLDVMTSDGGCCITGWNTVINECDPHCWSLHVGGSKIAALLAVCLLKDAS